MRASLLPAILLFAPAAFADQQKELPLDESWAPLPPGANTRDVTPLPVQEPQVVPLTPAQEEQKKNNPPAVGLSKPPLGNWSAAPVQTQVVTAPVRQPVPEDWNDVSLSGGRALKPSDWAIGGYAGFPTFGAQVRRGIFDGFDLGLGFESFYGMMNEGQLNARYQLTSGDTELAVTLLGSYAQFVLKPQNDPVGARWITGHRNWNVAPGLSLSHRASNPHMPRLFLSAQAWIAIDTQPYQRNPLGGVPQGAVPGWNVPVRMGGELPISSASSFVVTLGFDIHGRPGDAVFMPVLTVGAVVGL